MLDTLAAAVIVLLLGTAIIAVAGTFLARVSDALADRTGLGEAFVGGLLLAGATSLPDLTASVGAAAAQRPGLAMSTAMGSMAFNLVLLGIADTTYRRANLEHAAAAPANLTQAALLVALLAIPLIAANGPHAAAVWGVHVASPLIVAGYLGGMVLIRRDRDRPMWLPRHTPQTVEDAPPAGGPARGAAALWFGFGALAGITAAGGWAVMRAGAAITDHTGLAEGITGGLLMAAATSSPELVTSLAAVRRGALTLAVSNIVGTNCFNVLIVACADVAYRPGSVYHDLPAPQLAWGLVAILMTAVLLLGMLRRQTQGLANIGFESVLLLAIYAGAVATQFAAA